MLYSAAFWLLLALDGYLVYYTRFRSSGNDSGSIVAKTADFSRFEMTYLVVFWLMMGGDWLQGPYVYALYEAFGFERPDISFLFVVGFGSSMVFGTFIGSLADKWGRKRFCLLYVMLYVGSCVTKHFNLYASLMLGRLLGGISTSLLFSVFESWLVCEHRARGFDPAWLSGIFSQAWFGNSLVAIGSGLAAQWASDAVPFAGGPTFYWGGFTAPFDMAIAVLVLGGVVIFTRWSENYGDRGEATAEVTTEGATGPAKMLDSVREALQVMRDDPAVLNVGLVQSMFEGAMYCFVFMWTPALSSQDPNSPTPYGFIFSIFMLACMVGSQSFGILLKRFSVEQVVLRILCVGAAALGVAALGMGASVSFISFLVFEVCVGIYFPAMGTLKGKVVPEGHRATIYNLNRVPLNAIVLFTLLNNFSVEFTFVLCAALLSGAAILQLKINKLLAANATNKPHGE